MSEIDESNKKTLVGSFFLGDAKHPWYGRVIEAGPNGHYYYVECFATKATDVQFRRVVSIHTMSDWQFFGTVYQMRKNLAAAQKRWQESARQTIDVNEFFTDMMNLDEEKRLTGEQIYGAWLEWSKDKK